MNLAILIVLLFIVFRFLMWCPSHHEKEEETEELFGPVFVKDESGDMGDTLQICSEYPIDQPLYLNRTIWITTSYGPQQLTVCETQIEDNRYAQFQTEAKAENYNFTAILVYDEHYMSPSVAAKLKLYPEAWRVKKLFKKREIAPVNSVSLNAKFIQQTCLGGLNDILDLGIISLFLNHGFDQDFESYASFPNMPEIADENSPFILTPSEPDEQNYIEENDILFPDTPTNINMPEETGEIASDDDQPLLEPISDADLASDEN